MTRLLSVLLGAVALVAVAVAHGGHDSWPQWGGLDRNFQAGDADLATDWDESGPPALWRRPLGDGNSAISVLGRRLFTMHRKGESEAVVALDRRTGETLWERAWPAPTWKDFYDRYGRGPHVTPLVTGDRVYAAGIGGRLVCLEASSGDLIWQRELWETYELDPDGGGPSQLGYSSSPLLHRHMVLAVGGGPGRSVVALHRDTGEIIWSAEDLQPGFASPLLIQVGERRQLVVFGADRLIGLDPDTGRRLWQQAHETAYRVNASMPLWDGKSTLFVSSAYDTGSRALRLTDGGDGPRAEEIWSSREVKIHHQTSVLIDGRIYASSGDFGPTFLTAVDPSDGTVLFRQRGFAKANLVAVGGDLLILDEDGVLALGTAGREGIDVRARAQVFESRSWTVPTLVGTTLYARDRKEIAAFDLSPPERPEG